jgi:hypothetical protein
LSSFQAFKGDRTLQWGDPAQNRAKIANSALASREAHRIQIAVW